MDIGEEVVDQQLQDRPRGDRFSIKSHRAARRRSGDEGVGSNLWHRGFVEMMAFRSLRGLGMFIWRSTSFHLSSERAFYFKIGTWLAWRSGFVALCQGLISLCLIEEHKRK